ncbi:MAG: hypothetical protein J0L82_14560 [Deltaproteobacteria bacterium]|nr:hypothetical protein [Deltaproteobacteria bacterium]
MKRTVLTPQLFTEVLRLRSKYTTAEAVEMLRSLGINSEDVIAYWKKNSAIFKNH